MSAPCSPPPPCTAVATRFPGTVEQAQRWFIMAAERGHAHAQLMLSRYLFRGLAGETDPATALVWLERAAGQGLEEAQNELTALRAQGQAAPAAPETPQVDAGAR